MPSQKDIDEQKELLEAHRQTLSIYLMQRALLGTAFMPPGIANGINESRSHILRIKNVLRDWGAQIEDHPNDEESVVLRQEESTPKTTPGITGPKKPTPRNPFNGARGNFRNSNFSGRMDLIGADFTGADLTDANFQEANLTAAKFTDAIMVRANLHGAILKNTDINKANCRHIQFDSLEQLILGTVGWGVAFWDEETQKGINRFISES